MPMRPWQPTDDHLVQLLLNRGHLTQDQLLFASARRMLDGAPSLLAVLRSEGLVEPTLVARVLKEARQEALLRQLLRERGVLTGRQLAEATRQQRAERRTLVQTLIAGGFCSRETLRALLGQLAANADRGGFEPPVPPTPWLQPLHIA